MAIQWPNLPHPGPIRVAAWPGDHRIAQLLPTPAPYDCDDVRAVVDALVADGVERILTGPLTPAALDTFAGAGFRVLRTLVVLRRPLGEPVPRGPVSDRSAGVRQIDRLIAVDRAAFGPFWSLDRDGFERAVAATPVAQVRMVAGDDGPIAYAIAGRAAGIGYLQRLAVHPDHQGRGAGRALVSSTLRWMRRHRAAHALVNTETTNEAALGLYRSFGFVPDGDPLVIAERA